MRAMLTIAQSDAAANIKAQILALSHTGDVSLISQKTILLVVVNKVCSIASRARTCQNLVPWLPFRIIQHKF